MKNRIVSIALSCVILGSLILCGASETEAEELNFSEENTEITEDEAAEDENPVVFEDDIIKVSFMRLYEEPGIEGVYLQFDVENKSDEKITVYPQEAYVNDTQITLGSGVAMVIDVGKRSQNAFYMNTPYVGIESVDDIESVELQFWIVNDDFDTLDETDTFSVPLSKTKMGESDEGENPVVFEDDIIKVSFMRLYEEPGIEGVYLQFDVENKSDEKITVYPQEAYVNDTQITVGSGVAMVIDVGKRSQNAFYMNTPYIGIESVDDIESIDLQFLIVNDDFDTLDETNTFSVPLS